jgi:hypothetical protein
MRERQEGRFGEGRLCGLFMMRIPGKCSVSFCLGGYQKLVRKPTITLFAW